MTIISPVLPPVFEEDGWIRSLFASSDKVFGEPFKKRIEELRDRKNPYRFRRNDPEGRLTDPTSGESNEQNLWLIRALAYQLGWNYTDVFQGASNVDETAADFTPDQLNLFSQDELLRVVMDVARFYPVHGTSLWVDFISYLLNINLDVHRLWYDKREKMFVDEAIIKAVDAKVWSQNQDYPSGTYVKYTHNSVEGIYKSVFPVEKTGGTHVSLPPRSASGKLSDLWLSLNEKDEETSIRVRLFGKKEAGTDVRMIYGSRENAEVYPTSYISIEVRPEDFTRFGQSRFQNLMRKLIERMAPADLVIHSYILRTATALETRDDWSLVDTQAALYLETGADDSIQQVIVYGGSAGERDKLELVR